MKTLFIYDLEGKIIDYKTTTHIEEPKGIPFLLEEMPENAYPIKVNVGSENHFVEYGYHPKSETEILKEELENTKKELEATKEVVDFLIMGGLQ